MNDTNNITDYTTERNESIKSLNNEIIIYQEYISFKFLK